MDPMENNFPSELLNLPSLIRKQVRGVTDLFTLPLTLTLYEH